MQQIYRRTPIPKCDLSKVAKQHFWGDRFSMVERSLAINYFHKKYRHLLEIC